ncbi:MAG: hypothetical protein RIS47_1503 [Bacteroidota bacterium]
MTTRVVIIGAGLTGLSTAYKLKQAGVSFCVLESSERVGGVIQTQSQDGFVVEGGPNSGVIGNTEVIKLFDQLGNACTLEEAKDAVKKRYILKNGKWHALPMGIWSAITTPLFSLYDKFRILGEPFRRPGTDPHESLAALVQRRMGKSFLNYAIDPFILGVYAGDPALLVPKYALPKLYNLEQTYGSFIGGTIKKGREPKTEIEKRVSRKVFSVKGGLQSLTDTLYEKAGNENFVLSAKDVSVKPLEKGFEISYKHNGVGHKLQCEQVITTTGAFTLAAILPFVANETMQKITNLHHTRVVELQLGFRKWNGIPLDGFGGLIPFRENRQILGVMYMSSLIDNRAPEGGALCAVFVGGVRRQDLYELPDKELLEIALREFDTLMQTNGQKPDFVAFNRYEKAIPQYYANSGARFEACDTIEAQYPGLYIGGNLRDGIGMADRIQQAANLAKKVI